MFLKRSTYDHRQVIMNLFIPIFAWYLPLL